LELREVALALRALHRRQRHVHGPTARAFLVGGAEDARLHQGTIAARRDELLGPRDTLADAIRERFEEALDALCGVLALAPRHDDRERRREHREESHGI